MILFFQKVVNNFLRFFINLLTKAEEWCYNEDVNRGRHPLQKTAFIRKNITKGATPIIKNIIVVDEQGNQYEATYPKRAKGLVKTGRARFVSENTICLACPPDTNLEENKMTNTTINTVPTLTAKEIFDQIVALQNELGSLSHLTEAIQAIYQKDEDKIETEDENDDECEGNDTDVFKAKSVEYLTDVYTNREETYWKLLKMYERIYEDVVYDETPESFKKAIVHIMDYDENTMDANAKLGAIDALLQSQE